MNATVYKRVPGAVTIAEESTSWPGVTRPTSADGLGFGFKWNMGWMHDTLGYLQHDPVHRAYHHDEMTFSMIYAWSENFVLPLSHDEVVHGKGSLLRKMPGDRWQQLANLRAYLAFMWAHPGKQLLFMGAEFGQEAEWAEARELDWWLLDHPEHRGRPVAGARPEQGLPSTPRRCGPPTTTRLGFAWIDANDAGRNVFSFVRRGPDTPDVVCIANFSALPHEGYRIGLPVGRPLGRGGQHRRRGLHRLRRRQPRCRRGRARRLAGSAGQRDHRRTPARDRLAPQGLTHPPSRLPHPLQLHQGM